MSLLAVRLPDALEYDLNNLALKMHKPKSYIVREAIREYMEDKADYYIAASRLEEELPLMSLEEVKAQLGLDN